MGNPVSSHIAQYRGRLAPSPTGYLHVGHARTFWAAFERARAVGGTLVMRMDDLDRERSREIYAAAALEDLRWLGIGWQEGPGRTEPGRTEPDRTELGAGGPFAPYAQSQRHAIYLEAWRRLRAGGFLFPCHCTRKDLEAALGAPHESGSSGGSAAQNNFAPEQLDDEPVYPGTCRPGTCRPKTCRPNKSGALPIEEIATAATDAPGNRNWRFRVPDGEAVEFVDQNLGPQRFVAGRDFGDFLVWRRDSLPGSEGVPSYQLACVADDAAMQITEVVRGEDLLKSTARQILLYRALGLEVPEWFHCRLVVDAEGRRLAKRDAALSLRALREHGVTPAEILVPALR